MSRLKGSTVAVCIALGAASFGCEQPNWEDPAYVSAQLQEQDPALQRIAMEKVSDLSEEQQRQTIPALVAVYKGAGPYQKDAMSYLVQLRDPAAKEAYLAEMSANAVEFAGASAEALGEIGAKDAIPEMVKLLKSSDDPEVKLGVLRGFDQFDDPQLVEPLVEVLQLDVDNHPIQLHAYACDTLGDIAMEHPQAIDEAAIKQVTLAVFYANTKNQSLDKECGLAIQKIGDRAIPELIKIYKGEREDVQKLMMKYDTPTSPFPQNHPKIIAAKRLAALRAKPAVEVFHADLRTTKEAPERLKGNAAVNWRLKEGAATSETIYALGDIGDPSSREVLEWILVGDPVNAEWDDITDGLVALQFRQDAAYSLNRLGEREAVESLMKMADEGVIIDFEKRAALLEQSGNPVKETERYQFNWVSAQQAAYLALADKTDAYKALVESTSKDYPELAKKMAEYEPALALAKECGEGDPKAQASCYAGKLGDNSQIIREKAAWELGRLPAEVAAPVLVDKLPVDFLDTREILTFGIYRNPSPEAIGAIESLLKAEESRGGPDYKLDQLRLRLLHGWLKNHFRK